MEEILVPIGFFVSVFGIIYVLVAARNKERLALIEKGMDVSIFHKNKTLAGRKNTVLMFGILFIGVSIGLIIGAVFNKYIPAFSGPVAYFSMILLFGGASLLIFYKMIHKEKEQE